MFLSSSAPLFFAFCLFLPASSRLFLCLVVFSPLRYIFEEGRQTCCLFFFFFSIFARQGREMLGGTAVRNLQRQSTSGSCLWMSVSLLLLLDAPEDILHEWCLAACALPPRRQRCCDAAAFTETRGLFPLSFILFLTTHVCEEDANDFASSPSVVCLVRYGAFCWCFTEAVGFFYLYLFFALYRFDSLQNAGKESALEFSKFCFFSTRCLPVYILYWSNKVSNES